MAEKIGVYEISVYWLIQKQCGGKDIDLLAMVLEATTGISQEVWLRDVECVECPYCKTEWIDFGEKTCPSCYAMFEDEID